MPRRKKSSWCADPTWQERPIRQPSILMSKGGDSIALPEDLNDNKIINQVVRLSKQRPEVPVVLVTKDINMRLKARACGWRPRITTPISWSTTSASCRGPSQCQWPFWDRVSKVETHQAMGAPHRVQLIDNLPAVHINEFIIDERGFVGWIKGIKADELLLLDLHQEPLLHRKPGVAPA